MRGLGSLNFASKTFLALARLAAAGSSLGFAAAGRGGAFGAGRAFGAGGGSRGSSAGPAGVLAGAGGGERSSLTISSEVEISGSLSRVSTGLRPASSRGASPASPSSPRARRCASSLAFSAFLSASSSRLMRSSTQGPAARPERRLELRGVRLGEEIFAGQLAAEALEVAVDARIADHRRAQEDDQLGLAAEIAAVREDLAEYGDAADAGNAGVGVLHDVLHQACEHADLTALQAQHGVELTRLEDRNDVRHGIRIGGGRLQRGVRIVDRIDPPANRRPRSPGAAPPS